MKFSMTVVAIFAATVLATPAPPFDPSGAKNVGNGAGGQFIGGQCKSDADCGSGCCANPTGICSGPGAANQAGKTGCGFGGAAAGGAAGGAQSSAAAGGAGAAASPAAAAGGAQDAAAAGGAQDAAAATPAAAAASGAAGAGAASASPANGGPAFDPSGAKNVGNGKGAQFIGGQCLSGADCADGCCAGPSGICSGPGAATQAGKTGCGFSSQQKLRRF